ARNLAEFMFGDKEALIQIDMSEYMEKFTSSRLIGSPPGYVGYEEGGQLSEAVRRRPYSVVLFDEIEKAHPDVMNLLLQILEEGIITDSLGRKIDFRNTIIIRTTNVGADVIKRQVTLGFGSMGGGDENYDNMRDKILERAKEAFKPEFLNRLDEKIVFHVLDRDNLIRIVDLEIGTVVKRLATKNIHLKLDKKAKEFLIEQGYDPNYGARPMRRAVERHIEDPLAEHLLRGDITPGQVVKITHKKDEKYLTFRAESADSPEDDAVESVSSADGSGEA
ncbi:MAG: AAA family ATPase, partial [Verrucomicrobiales bacterium]